MIDEKQIQDWLVEEGIFRQKIPDDNSNFHFLINYPNNNALDVICPKGKDDQIIIGCATEVSQQEQALIHNTKKAVNQEFIWNIRFALNSFMLDFELAEIYGYETKAFNQQVKRNIEKSRYFLKL